VVLALPGGTSEHKRELFGRSIPAFFGIDGMDPCWSLTYDGGNEIMILKKKQPSFAMYYIELGSVGKYCLLWVFD
jgi:hypothetical protein